MFEPAITGKAGVGRSGNFTSSNAAPLRKKTLGDAVFFGVIEIGDALRILCPPEFLRKWLDLGIENNQRLARPGVDQFNVAVIWLLIGALLPESVLFVGRSIGNLRICVKLAHATND